MALSIIIKYEHEKKKEVGDILIFVPGLVEIKTLKTMIMKDTKI